MKPTISVIIPVYNVANYLKQCLDSVINSTFQNIEIICVNDGSTDNSLQILEEYSQKDNRIIIINQKNKGLSGARNSGLKVAKGEYIYFLDSDDWIKNDLLEKCYNKIIKSQADILVFGTYNVYENVTIENKRKISGFIKRYNRDTVYFQTFPQVYTQSCTAWTKFIKKSFLDDNKVYFNEDVKFSEDSVFWIEVLFNNPKITLLDKCLYYYRIKRREALTSEQSDIIQKQWKAFEFLKNNKTFKEASSENKLLALDFFAIAIMCHYSDITNIKLLKKYEADILPVINEFKNYKQYNLWRYSGYRTLKFRHIYTIAKKLILFILKIKSKRKDIGYAK